MNEGVARVDFWGIEREVRLDRVGEPIRSGDYVINHLGYAIRKIDEDAVADTLALYEVVLTEAGVDPIATECFCDEISAPVEA